MTLQQRDKRALVVLAVAVVVYLIVWLWPSGEPSVAGASFPNSVPLAEKRLARLRELAAAAPGREEVLRQVSDEVGKREKGLLQADTAAQAQAQLYQILRRVGRAQAPPVEIRNTEIGQVRPFGQDYGEVSVAVQFDCRIDQLVNLLADLTQQPELLATSEVRISSANEKQKVLAVRLTVSGVVPRRLVPEKKGIF